MCDGAHHAPERKRRDKHDADNLIAVVRLIFLGLPVMTLTAQAFHYLPFFA